MYIRLYVHEHIQSNLNYPSQLGPGQSVWTIESLDNQGKAIWFSIAWSSLTCSDNQEVWIIEVWIIEVGTVHVFVAQL